MTYYGVNDQKGTVPAITLEDLTKRFNLRGATLKMNCEGCEYDIILNDYDHVKMFEELLFQYHAHVTKISAKLLLRKLSEDFACEIVSNKEFYRKYGGSKRYHGLIRCFKR